MFPPPSPTIFTHDWKGLLGDKFGIKGISHMVLVGRDGLVNVTKIGYDDSKLPELAKQIDLLIAESYE